MATPQPSSASEQSSQVDLLPMPTTMPINFGSQQLSSSGRQFSQAMVQASIPASLGSYPLAFANKQSVEMVRPPNDQIPMSVYLGLGQSEQTSKLQSGMEPSPRIQNQASVNVGATFPLASNKQQARMESLQKLQTTLPMITGSQQVSLINRRPTQTELPVKVQTEFELVRSKLRESLTSALATGYKEQSKQKSPEKSSVSEEKCLLKQAEVSSVQNEIHSAADGSLCESLPNYLTSNRQVKKVDENKGLPSEVGSSGNIGDKKEANNIYNVQGKQNNDILMDDAPFSSHSVMEDELLQGHGLSWASDFDSVSVDSPLSSVLKRAKLMHVEEHRDMKGTLLQTSENLAVQIEAELFKLFGGVNKKYKEKGRSLLFNLKDPSNPELRERVLSGDVPPERLCSMTPEELASKELSQWRQAKAEELAQMVVLPDMNIDIRRLLRKTHKGEFQVEVDLDDSAQVEVGLESDVLLKTPEKANEVDQSQPRSNDKGLTFSRTHDSEISYDLLQGEKSDSDGRNVSSSLDPRLREKNDFIQDFMVEELKDTELLPPVVSLDEFMQALDSEPPFENLEVNNLQGTPGSVDRDLDRSEFERSHASGDQGHKVDSTPDISVSKLASGNILYSQLDSGHVHTKHAKEISSSNTGQVDYSYQKSDDKLKIDSAYVKQVTGIPDSASKYNYIWEGLLHLNVSALSSVVSFFLSGERTSMQEWPNLLEVKGRVRLDAFEKFLQELPLSRSRAIMVVEFRWKEDSMESGRVHLSEAIHSYITDERLGFAEPAPGVELYLCPPHPKITDMLAKHLSKELLENINCVVNGLIGIVVWRRPHVIISPRVSSHHKRGSTKKHSSSKKHHESMNHSNSNHIPSKLHRNPIPQPDEEDDVPPGFGPPIAREDDDLPEFDFSHGRSSHRAAAAPPQHSAMVGGHSLAATAASPACPSEHMRELIQKYGQGESNVRELGIPVQPWNDDDDIPEWNPNQNTKQMPQQSLSTLPPTQLHVYQQQQRNTEPFAINQQLLVPPQQPMLQPNAQFIHAPLHAPIQPLPLQNIVHHPTAMWRPVPHGIPDDGALRPCHFGGQLSAAGPLPGVGPRMVHGFGGPRNGLGLWRPDNSTSRGV